MWFPLDSTQYAGLHLTQLPQHLALFCLGAAGARRGWFAPVPDSLRRVCGSVALFSTLAIGSFAVVALSGVPTTAFYGGVSWASLATATVEGLLAVNLAVWLLGLAQRHLGDRPALPHAARSAYAAYLAQGPVLVGLALLLRPVGLPAEVKAVAVSVVGVLVSFGLGWILVARTRLRRIL